MMEKPPPSVSQPGHIVLMTAETPSPPKYVLMPNQPHATTARRIAGMFAPVVPNDARASTGNGTPYFVPGCALRRIGTSTIIVPTPMVSSACHQFMPAAIIPPASVYVG